MNYPIAAVTADGRILERDRELASLERLIDEAGGDQAHVALVEGPAGIGKTIRPVGPWLARPSTTASSLP